MYDLKGNWKAGWAIDLHTISSNKTENGFNTIRTDIGNALYQLKYCDDYSKIEPLSQELINFMGTRFVTNYIGVILPVPPSKTRTVQPVSELAIRLGKGIHKPVDLDYIKKIASTSELKSIDNPNERAAILKNAFKLESDKYRGKKILLVDDLYRSGSTLKEITRVLYEQGNVENVYVVTLTKTRSKL